MKVLLISAIMTALISPTLAAAVGSTGDDSVCQFNDTSTATVEHVPIVLNSQWQPLSIVLRGSEHLSNCSDMVFCVNGSNVTFPDQIELEDTHDGSTTMSVTIPREELTEAIRELSLMRFCCVDEVPQPDGAKCYVLELKYAPVRTESMIKKVTNNESPVAGDNITLTCPLISNPPGNYSWAHGSTPGPFNISSERELTLAPFRREHVGCYYCRVDSELGSKTVDFFDRPFYWKVEAYCESQEKAAIHLSAPQIEVEEGSTAVVNCTWSYLKLRAREITWMGPNKTNNFNTNFYSDDFTCMGGLEMRIKNFTDGMEGDYTCKVDNPTYSGTKTVRLILAKPLNTTGKPFSNEVPSSAAGVIVGVSVSLVGVLVAMVTLLLVVLLVYIKRRRPGPGLSVLTYGTFEKPPREGFKYDAFLSFHDECDGFVCDHILKPLKAEGYKVCYHHDDFQPGIGIYDNIHGNMDNSRVAILVLSKSYTSSEYCREEMRYAIQAARLSHSQRLLPVAWRKEEVPKELLGLTYLEVKEGKEGELAKEIGDWIGEPIDCSPIPV